MSTVVIRQSKIRDIIDAMSVSSLVVMELKVIGFLRDPCNFMLSKVLYALPGYFVDDRIERV